MPGHNKTPELGKASFASDTAATPGFATLWQILLATGRGMFYAWLSNAQITLCQAHPTFD
ncbi:MAG: hypothetical protein ACF8OB_06675 [Phycisphaeraceae bacterium JB051]